MKLFKKPNNENYTVVIGCGRLGSNIANTLSNEGQNVLIIDERQDSFKRLASNFGGLTILGDGTDLDILKEANIKEATNVIVVTNDDNTNILISQMVKEIFKVKNVVSRLNYGERDIVYSKYDIVTICPAVLSVKEISNLFAGGNV